MTMILSKEEKEIYKICLSHQLEGITINQHLLKKATIIIIFNTKVKEIKY